MRVVAIRVPLVLLVAAAGMACAAGDARVAIEWHGDRAAIDIVRAPPIVRLPTALKNVIAGKFPGYRLPSSDDYKLDWIEFYDSNKVPFLVLGDFNHDGLQDIAARLKNEVKDEVWKLVIFHGPNFDPIEILASPDTKTESRSYGAIQRNGLGVDTTCSAPPCLASYVYESASFIYVWTGKSYAEVSTGD